MFKISSFTHQIPKHVWTKSGILYQCAYLYHYVFFNHKGKFFKKKSLFVSSYIICGEAHIKLAIFLSFRGLNIHAKHSFTCLLNLQIAMKCSVEFLGKNFEICSLTSLSIFALEMEDIEAKNSLAMASPKSVEDTWVQYCHRG